jgi:polysaccharide biosynthesis protein PelG
MAGIGFRLQKLVSGDSYTDLIKAYAFSSVIASGPMIIVIISLSMVHNMGKAWMGPDDASYFVGLAVYCFAGAMLGVGGILNIVTRYIADHYFHQNFDVFTPTYLSALEFTIFFQSIPAIAFLYHAPILFHEKWVAYMLFMFINGIWLAMAFLSAAKSYLWIVWAYVIGGAAGIVAGMILGPIGGFFGVLAAFTLGQAVTFLILTFRIFREFGYKRSSNFDFVLFFKKHPYLFWVGTFINLGVWADKFLMWNSPLGVEIGPLLYGAPDYDTPIFLAYVMVIPSMAFFLVQMETSFAKSYTGYFRSIQTKEAWQAILGKKEELLTTITKNFQMFIVFQGIITGLAIILVYDLAEILSLNFYQLGIFRIGLLATFLQMGFLMFLNLYFYFDFQKEVFWISFIFCVSNTALTYITIQIGHETYGFGLMASCFIGLLLTFLVLDHKLKRLDYYTFMQQAILVPKFDLETDE